jgi:hypothetical protein
MVIAILMVIVGAVTIATLPIAQFPNIAPPEIRLQANYPGADAKTLEDSVATPIEQQVNGADNMAYMYSLNARANQQVTLLADFDLKTDPNTDLLLTQSREQLATCSGTTGADDRARNPCNVPASMPASRSCRAAREVDLCPENSTSGSWSSLVNEREDEA